ncbi:MAG: substrate-binding domain-containing protein [Eubacteriales bacterium]|nr:substrate-binding domain-containing protein [Eubacteriales bacterium]
MKKNRRWLAALLIAVLLLAGFGLWRFYRLQVNRENYHVIAILKSIARDNDFWPEVEKGIRSAGEQYRMTVEVTGPTLESDVDRQNEIIMESIDKRPDAIILAPGDYQRSADYAAKIREAGITLVLVDSDMAGRSGVTLVATNNVLAGKKVGQLLEEAIAKKQEDARTTGQEKVAILSYIQNTSTARDRERGVISYLEEKEIPYIGPFYTQSNSQTAEEMATGILQENPDLTYLVGLNEWSAVGASRALIAMGKQDRVKIIGFDSSKSEAKFLEQEVLYGIVAQNPYSMGYLSVESAYKRLRGKAVLDDIDSGSKQITKETMYNLENEKLLFPFSGE